MFVFIGFATPDFWLALLLMILFGVQLGWLPISGLRSLNWEYLAFWPAQWDFSQHLVLPIAVATFGGLAGFSRYMRQSMLEVVRQDYVQAARAKGLSERLVIAARPAERAPAGGHHPGLSLPGLIGGSVIIESIFAIPGMGQLMVQSVFSRDYPLMMGNLVIVATLTLFANLVADITYGVVDPRIRLGGAAAGRRVASRLRRVGSCASSGAGSRATGWRSAAPRWCGAVLIPGGPGPAARAWDPHRPDTKKILHPPSSSHWLGTDPLGRDVLSRVLYGSRISLAVGFVSVGIAAAIGVVLGAVAGYHGGTVDDIDAAGRPDAGLPALLPAAGRARVPPAVDLDHHGRHRPHRLDGRRPARARGVPDAPGARVRVWSRRWGRRRCGSSSATSCPTPSRRLVAMTLGIPAPS